MNATRSFDPYDDAYAEENNQADNLRTAMRKKTKTQNLDYFESRSIESAVIMAADFLLDKCRERFSDDLLAGFIKARYLINEIMNTEDDDDSWDIFFEEGDARPIAIFVADHGVARERIYMKQVAIDDVSEFVGYKFNLAAMLEVVNTLTRIADGRLSDYEKELVINKYSTGDIKNPLIIRERIESAALKANELQDNGADSGTLIKCELNIRLLKANLKESCLKLKIQTGIDFSDVFKGCF